MANLSTEEPDALVRARPGLWEPWVGNDPRPPDPPAPTARPERSLHCVRRFTPTRRSFSPFRASDVHPSVR